MDTKLLAGFRRDLNGFSLASLKSELPLGAVDSSDPDDDGDPDVDTAIDSLAAAITMHDQAMADGSAAKGSRHDALLMNHMQNAHEALTGDRVPVGMTADPGSNIIDLTRAAAFRELRKSLDDTLADFRLSRIQSNSNSRLIAVKELRKSVDDLLTDLRLLPRFSSPLFEVKRSSNGAQIKAYASTFGVLDMQDEIVDPGAFSVSLAEHRRANSQPQMLWMHEQNEVVGIWQKLAEDSKGLIAEGLLLSSVQRGKEAIALLDAGAELGCSIGFRTVRDRVVNKVRHLQQVNLVEISIVSFPATPGTRIQLAGKEYDLRDARFQ